MQRQIETCYKLKKKKTIVIFCKNELKLADTKNKLTNKKIKFMYVRMYA